MSGFMRRFMKMYLSPDGGQGGGTGGEGAGQAQQNAGQSQQGQQSQPPAIDYEKIQQMLDGTLAAKEDTALKAYFKQQGLSQQEAEQAMAAFKKQKAANQPDVATLQTQAAQAQEAARQAQLQSAATMAAVSLGMDAKSIPYVLKMADLGKVMGQDGKINEEALKAALNKVLEDVPALKPQAGGTAGFVQVGAAGQNRQTQGDNSLSLKDAVSAALKK